VGLSFSLKVTQLITSLNKSKLSFTGADDGQVSNEMNAYWRKVIEEEFTVNHDKNFVLKNRQGIKEKILNKMIKLQSDNIEKAEKASIVSEMKEEKEAINR